MTTHRPLATSSWQPTADAGLVEALIALRDAGDPYPPPEAGTTRQQLHAWLTSGASATRWVVLDRGHAVGHVQVGPAHGYLIRFFADNGMPRTATTASEVGRLFTHPELGRGAGSVLLATARDHVVRQGRVLALAVVDTSTAAISLYERAGLTCVGTFDGVHGRNHVYVDTAARS